MITRPQKSTHSDRSTTGAVKEWTGFLVVNADRVVLGVYGSAIRDMAEELRQRLTSQFPGAKVQVITYTAPKRPHVGDTAP
jgi:hypothetical protein